MTQNTNSRKYKTEKSLSGSRSFAQRDFVWNSYRPLMNNREGLWTNPLLIVQRRQRPSCLIRYE